jgi:hypothetical protein
MRDGPARFLRFFARERNDLAPLVWREGRRGAAALFIFQARYDVGVCAFEPVSSPQPHRRRGRLELACHVLDIEPRIETQHDSGSQGDLLRRLVPSREPGQFRALLRAQRHLRRFGSWHPGDSLSCEIFLCYRDSPGMEPISYLSQAVLAVAPEPAQPRRHPFASAVAPAR